ncbi:MAG: tetratricopeptide repeat protein [Alphaproteobacteria bacterium]|nr:tetratricopeptide repeat protein [Alphaproteobacteria bacterium]
MLSVIQLALGLVLAPAYAGVVDDLDRAGVSAEELVVTAEQLDHRIAPGRAFLNNVDAVGRFEDNLFALMVGEYRKAAEGFFGLVTTGALQDADLHRDAEWYLAEALFGMGNVVTAEARFRVVAEDDGHPFREDAVRRLLELYAKTDQDERFTELYEKEIVRGRVNASGVVTYTIARSFYQRGDIARARDYFKDLPPGDPWYTRAQYFLGVLELREGDIDGAIPFFQAASEGSVTDVAQRKTQDLALLALARLAYERSDFEKAGEYYQVISGDSPYLADVLREQVWSFIKQNRYDEALRAAELFLLAFPEHRYAGELRVVQGHLYMGCGQQPDRCPQPDLPIGEGDAYERALTTYEKIVEDYEPVRDRFSDLASSKDEPGVYFQKVFAAHAPDDSGLPPFAVAMMRGDEELDHALRVYERIEEQRTDLFESELMVAELEAILSGPTAVGGFEASRYMAIVNQARAIREQVELLEIEKAWLAEQDVSGLERFDTTMASIQSMSKDAEERIRSQRELQTGRDDAASSVSSQITEVERMIEEGHDEIDKLRRRLAAPNILDEAGRRDVERELSDVETILRDSRTRLTELRVRLSQLRMPTVEDAPRRAKPGEVDKELTQAIGSLRQSYQSVRPGQTAEIAKRFDAVHERLRTAQELYSRVLDRIETLAESEIARVRERFAAEAVEVRAQRAEIDDATLEAEKLAVSLTRSGFARMEDFFADSVLKAEMGIIDVYWARKLEIADQRERIQDERNMLVAELERRFAIIRQKMEQ